MCAYPQGRCNVSPQRLGRRCVVGGRTVGALATHGTGFDVFADHSGGAAFGVVGARERAAEFADQQCHDVAVGHGHDAAQEDAQRWRDGSHDLARDFSGVVVVGVELAILPAAVCRLREDDAGTFLNQHFGGGKGGALIIDGKVCGDDAIGIADVVELRRLQGAPRVAELQDVVETHAVFACWRGRDARRQAKVIDDGAGYGAAWHGCGHPQ